MAGRSRARAAVQRAVPVHRGPPRRRARLVPERASPARRRRARELVWPAHRCGTRLPAQLGGCRYDAPMESLKPLIALLAIVNPIGVVPFFITFTQNFTPEQRRRTIRVSAFS